MGNPLGLRSGGGGGKAMPGARGGGAGKANDGAGGLVATTVLDFCEKAGGRPGEYDRDLDRSSLRSRLLKALLRGESRSLEGDLEDGEDRERPLLE